MSGYRSLEAMLCWTGIPGCPESLVFILPVIALMGTLTVMKSTGISNPFLPIGATLTTLAAAALAIAPNPALVMMVLAGAAGTAFTFLSWKRG